MPHTGNRMIHLLFTSLIILSAFLGSDCREEPVQPCTDCPQPIDTTSHNFSWRLDTLGDGNSSILFDVAVLNDTLAFAVGAMYLRDSTGKLDPQPYNLAEWNGRNWKLRKLSYAGFPPVIKTICVVNDQDVWLDPWFHWNGHNFQELPIDPILFGVGVNKMWGNSKGVYVIGDNGFIAYKSSTTTTWQKLESGTTLPIQDIWGSKNSQTGETEILAIASNGSLGEGKKLLSIKNNSVISLPDSGLPPFGLYGLWFEPKKRYFVVGAGIYYKDNAYNTARWDTVKNITTYYTIAMRGTGINNIIAVGAFGDVLHYNGTSWKQYSDLKIDGSYINVDVKGKIVALCGYTTTQGVIVIGKQQ